jgi:hypothetical protein
LATELERRVSGERFTFLAPDGTREYGTATLVHALEQHGTAQHIWDSKENLDADAFLLVDRRRFGVLMRMTGGYWMQFEEGCRSQRVQRLQETLTEALRAETQVIAFKAKIVRNAGMLERAKRRREDDTAVTGEDCHQPKHAHTSATTSGDWTRPLSLPGPKPWHDPKKWRDLPIERRRDYWNTRMTNDEKTRLKDMLNPNQRRWIEINLEGPSIATPVTIQGSTSELGAQQ